MGSREFKEVRILGKSIKFFWYLKKQQMFNRLYTLLKTEIKDRTAMADLVQGFLPESWGLLLPKELMRLDLLPLLLVGRLLLPERGAAGGIMTAGGTLPSLVYKDSISCFWRLCRSWISLRCLWKISRHNSKILKPLLFKQDLTIYSLISIEVLTFESLPQMYLI